MTTPTAPRADSQAVQSSGALSQQWYRWAADMTAALKEQERIIEQLRAQIAALQSGGS